jgi:hypothetical protein
MAPALSVRMRPPAPREAWSNSGFRMTFSNSNYRMKGRCARASLARLRSRGSVEQSIRVQPYFSEVGHTSARHCCACEEKAVEFRLTGQCFCCTANQDNDGYAANRLRPRNAVSRNKFPFSIMCSFAEFRSGVAAGVDARDSSGSLITCSSDGDLVDTFVR